MIVNGASFVDCMGKKKNPAPSTIELIFESEGGGEGDGGAGPNNWIFRTGGQVTLLADEDEDSNG